MNITPLSHFADYLGISSLLLPVFSAQRVFPVTLNHIPDQTKYIRHVPAPGSPLLLLLPCMKTLCFMHGRL